MRKIFLIVFLLLTLASLAMAQTALVRKGGTGDTTLSGILIGKGQKPVGGLAFPNDSTKYLRGDTTWHTISGGGGSGLINWIDSLNTSTPNATVPAVALVVKNAATNVDAVIQAKGTGAILAQIPNNLASGGNKRGLNAVDLQTSRAVANNVASGDYTVISGGSDNISGGDHSSVVGGLGNTANGDYSVVGGTANNTSSFAGVLWGHNNSSSGNNAVISGGFSNIISGNNCAIAGGGHLTLSGNNDFGFQGVLGSLPMTISASNVSAFINTDLWLANNDNAAGALYFYAPYNTSGAFPNGTNYVGFKAGAVSSSVIWTLPLADGTANQSLVTDGSGTLSWATAGGGGLVNWTDSINTSAPNATVPVVALVAKNAATDVDAVIQPKGAGGIAAQIANNALSGGNKRGQNAVDLQTLRDVSASEVASGDQSVLGGGEGNKSAGLATVVAGGFDNVATHDYSVVSGGESNLDSGYDCVIGGGTSNKIYDNKSVSTIGGGGGNIINANGAAIPGGRNMTLNGTGDFGFNGLNTTLQIDTAGVAVFGNVDIWLADNDNKAHALKFYAPKNGGSNPFPNTTKYVGFKAPAAITNSRVYLLPADDGTNGQVLSTDGSQNLSWATITPGTGTVTSVALALPVSVFTISGSPVTTSGTLTGSFATQSANTFFSGPTSGGAATPTFRTMVLADLPSGYQYYAWSSNSGTSFTAAVANAYNTTAGSQATITLPAATDNQRVLVKGNNTGGWIITLSSQTIHFPGQDYTVSIASTDGEVELVYNAATSKWDVINMTGTIMPL